MFLGFEFQYGVRSERKGNMEAISPAFGVQFVGEVKKYSISNGFSGSILPSLRSFIKICKRNSVYAENRNPSIDLSDPGWKTKFQEDFERRFYIPHLSDFFDDVVPIPSTFCLKSRLVFLLILLVLFLYFHEFTIFKYKIELFRTNLA